jgi:hypothetical protein
VSGRRSAVLYKRTLSGLGSLYLVLLLTACAGRGTVPGNGVSCPHPEINPTTNDGLSAAVAAYQEALERCNALNYIETNEED